MNIKDWNEYFESTGEQWVKEAYHDADYTYPVGYHRLRILKRILKDYSLQGKRVLDIGCGGGDISFYVASMGAAVDGVDMTETMLNVANKKKKDLPETIRKQIHFHHCEFHEIHKILQGKYDIVIAFGFIGYLESDDVFFETIDSFCRSETVLILSCRNRLFNITSISPNTIEEIQKGNAISLIEEIDRYWMESLPAVKQKLFIETIKDTAKRLNSAEFCISSDASQEHVKGLPGTGTRQPRQSTPESLKKDALKFNFTHKQFFGVHPHLLLPRMNKRLPPSVFNLLSDTLCVFEDEPISLIYSSVFIAKFVKE